MQELIVLYYYWSMTLFFNLKHFFDIVLKSLNLIYRPTTNKIHFRLLPEIRWLYINNLPVGLHAISTVHVLCGTNIDQLSQLIYTRPYWILQATHSRSATTASSPALNGVTLCIVLAAQPGWDSLQQGIMIVNILFLVFLSTVLSLPLCGILKIK